MTSGVHSQQVLPAHFWCIDMTEHVEKPGCEKSILYRREAPGALGVTLTGVMLAAIEVADIRGTQSGSPLL